MQWTLRPFASLSMLLLVGGALGCSSSSSANDAGPQVSFTNDVMPIFIASCATGSVACHGATTVPERPFLGLPMGNTADDTARAYAAIVSQPSSEAPGILLVKPHDSANSFLWDKVDNLQDGLMAQCTGNVNVAPIPPCGLSMPSGSTLLPQAMRATIQAWIDEGAPQN